MSGFYRLKNDWYTKDGTYYKKSEIDTAYEFSDELIKQLPKSAEKVPAPKVAKEKAKVFALSELNKGTSFVDFIKGE
jgi:hypothetical protein